MEYREDFLKWINDDSYISDYDEHTFPDHHFLLRVYLYAPEIEDDGVNILGLDGKSATKKKREVLVPYAKVIKKGKVNEDSIYYNINPGDIVAIPDGLTYVERNPHYDQWMEAMKERPAPEGTPPPMYVGAISRWFPYQFLLNKLETADKPDDVMDMTFSVPQANLSAKIEKSFFDKYKVSEVVKP